MLFHEDGFCRVENFDETLSCCSYCLPVCLNSRRLCPCVPSGKCSSGQRKRSGGLRSSSKDIDGEPKLRDRSTSGPVYKLKISAVAR